MLGLLSKAKAQDDNNKMESLEGRVQKPDWRQWIPIYGLFPMAKAYEEGKPTIVANSSKLRYFLVSLEHALPPVIALSVPVYYLLRWYNQ